MLYQAGVFRTQAQEAASLVTLRGLLQGGRGSSQVMQKFCNKGPMVQLRREKLKAKEKRKDNTHLNAEFQRLARKDKEAFLSDQCKEVEENNRIGKARDLFKKIRDTKGTFHAKIGSIKDRNGIDLTEAEHIKKWQEYTEELYKKDLRAPDNHDGVITHLEPDVLECEVK